MRFWCPCIMGGDLLHEVMNMEKCNPYSFYVVKW